MRGNKSNQRNMETSYILLILHSKYKNRSRTSLAVQWLRFHISCAEGTYSTPGQGAIDPTWHVAQPKKKLFIKTAFQIAWKELLKAKRKESSSWESLVGDSCFPATTVMVIFEKRRPSFPIHPIWILLPSLKRPYFQIYFKMQVLSLRKQQSLTF